MRALLLPSPPLATRAGGGLKRARRRASHYSIVKQPPASPCGYAGHGAPVSGRASSPLFFARPGASRTFFAFFAFPSPEGACGTPGVSPRPRRHVVRHAGAPHGALRREAQGSRCSLRRSKRRGCLLEQPATEAGRRLRSARDGFDRSAACPQELSLLSTRRLVRADCRPDTHLNRPPDPASRLRASQGTPKLGAYALR